MHVCLECTGHLIRDRRFTGVADLKEFLVGKGVLEENASIAAPLLYRAGFTSRNAFHMISAPDLRPPLNVPLSNQIAASFLRPADCMFVRLLFVWWAPLASATAPG